jgi:hypothetical protein
VEKKMSKGKHTDTELLDFLQSLNDKKEYTGKCVLRMSATGRGWRLHETGRDDVVDDGFFNVRQAIESFKDSQK